ncbi:NAD(P)-dependent oxidoreductase [Martelella sp. FOR1707]
MENATSTQRTVSHPKLLVLGATGGTGRLIVAQAISRGYEVTVLARNAEKAKGLKGAKIVIGNALDPATLRSALEGQDAVVSALGTPASPFRKVTLLSAASKVLVAAMKDEGVRKLVAITGMGAGKSRGHGGFVFDRLIMPLMLRKVYADKNRQEDVIRTSGLDWMIVRPSVLNDKPPRGNVRALLDLEGFNGGTIARADVAGFVLDQVESETFKGQAPLVTW